MRGSLSDLRFTDSNRVPFPFAPVMRESFELASMVTASNGPELLDLDGNWSLDVGGSYGVNVCGYEQYKEWIERGWQKVKDLGPVLGPLHPVVGENVEMLKAISGKDEVSFHMSGTEAVMAAVRLARFNTGRKHIVAFSGAYHGWWDGVQPGLGSERALTDCLALRDMDPASLRVIRARAKQIAAVLVNPVQSFHPNAPPPNDAVLMTSETRRTDEATGAYGTWLQQLRRVCRECDVPLIFDEVYSGFRLGPGGAQELYGIDADMVVYGKTVGGGLPIGVVCGRADLMRRFDPRRPMRIAYVVGTFSGHPHVMGAMNEFLRWVVTPQAAQAYAEADTRCGRWAEAVNRELAGAELPLQVVRLGTIWTVLFQEPGRYNWLLQYYLRAEGLSMTWVGTGRCISSLDFTEEHYQQLRVKLLAAAHAMKRDGWWLSEAQLPGRERKMKQHVAREVAAGLVPQPLHGFYSEVMRRKEHDHHASHNNRWNQITHLISSSMFIGCYVLIFFDLTAAMLIGLGSLFIRQIGHAILEPPCHDAEQALLGFNTRNKTIIVAAYTVIPIVQLLRIGTAAGGTPLVNVVAEQWFVLTLLVVFGRVAWLVFEHGFFLSMVWLIKLVTDPFTDLKAYWPAVLPQE
jgi:glutamate-1-semialdehyde 2,1-aminomutase